MKPTKEDKVYYPMLLGRVAALLTHLQPHSQRFSLCPLTPGRSQSSAADTCHSVSGAAWGICIPCQSAWVESCLCFPSQPPDGTRHDAAGDGLSPWVPVTYVGNPDAVLGSWVWPAPVLAVVNLWGVSRRPLSVCLSFKE